MTKEIIRQIERDYWEEKADPIDMAEIFDLAQKALEQEPMRDATPEELKSVNDYIKSISKPTGVKFDFDEEQEQIDFVQSHKTVGKLISVDILDKIRAEIIERDRNVKAIRSDGCCFFTVEEVLQIIDKYKESEEE